MGRLGALLAIIVLAASAAACGGGHKSGDANGPARVQVQLQQQNGSGESGTATLTSTGDKTRVVVNLVSYAAVAQPAHIHHGTCVKLDPTPAYPLNALVKGKSTTVVDAPLSKLLKGSFAINVHWSAKDVKRYVACGNIGENHAPAQTYTTSDEGDGY
jgi:hypothetical protein